MEAGAASEKTTSCWSDFEFEEDVSHKTFLDFKLALRTKLLKEYTDGVIREDGR